MRSLGMSILGPGNDSKIQEAVKMGVGMSRAL